MTSDQPGTTDHFARHGQSDIHIMVVPCKPLTKDHLPLKTAFSGPKRWSLVTGFTVIEMDIQSNLVRTNTDKANFPLIQTKANPMVGQASIQVKIIRFRRTSVQRTFAKTSYFQV